MARQKKKGQSGAARNFVTRNQAVRKLQLPLSDFRRLCIWKGIYPREPRSKKKVSKSATASTTFYYTKDIQYLLHEPLVQKFRDQKVLEKKIARALGRGDVSDASRLEKNAGRPEITGKPRYTLNTVVRERYPTFQDALRDLDDCLSLLFLFASLSATPAVPAKMIARCERLCLEFQHYLIATRSVTKSFLSIKGIYYQANIHGEDILWLVPHKFTQRILGDIDFRIMGTFVEFYMTMLGVVNFRLYTSMGLKYPPKFDQTKDENSAELGAFTLEGTIINALEGVTLDSEQKTITEATHQPDPETQAAADKALKAITSSNGADEGEEEEDAAEKDAQNASAIDKFQPVAPGGDVLLQPTSTGTGPGGLFLKFTVFLSRETPRQPLEFLLKAFGCKRVGWDVVLGAGSFTSNELDPSITHQIVDRPVIRAAVNEEGDGEDNQTSQKVDLNRRVPGRIYVQPQWVWDCINDGELKDSLLYAPDASLPPHLSPFVKRVQGAYDPTVPLEEQEPEQEALEAAAEEVEEDEEGAANDMDVAASDDDDFEGVSADEEEQEEVHDEEEDDEAAKRQMELEAEMAGASVKPQTRSIKAKANQDARKALAKKTQEEEEALDRAKGMLSKKKRKLYEQMQYTNNKKSAKDQELRSKRRKFEKEKAKEKA